MTMIQTPGGYEYEDPETDGQPDVAINLPFADAFDVLLDGLQSEASIQPLTAETFRLNAYNLLHLLIDASADSEAEAETLAGAGSTEWKHCTRGSCAGREGHEGTCAEASGW
ncbi:hypothetical protein LG293_15890 (plasmid) [Citricoccus nitrophenolicus]